MPNLASNPRKYTNMTSYSVCDRLWCDREMAQNEMVSQISCSWNVMSLHSQKIINHLPEQLQRPNLAPNPRKYANMFSSGVCGSLW